MKREYNYLTALFIMTSLLGGNVYGALQNPNFTFLASTLGKGLYRQALDGDGTNKGLNDKDLPRMTIKKVDTDGNTLLHFAVAPAVDPAVDPAVNPIDVPLQKEVVDILLGNNNKGLLTMRNRERISPLKAAIAREKNGDSIIAHLIKEYYKKYYKPDDIRQILTENDFSIYKALLADMMQTAQELLSIPGLALPTAQEFRVDDPAFNLFNHCMNICVPEEFIMKLADDPRIEILDNALWSCIEKVKGFGNVYSLDLVKKICTKNQRVVNNRVEGVGQTPLIKVLEHDLSSLVNTGSDESALIVELAATLLDQDGIDLTLVDTTYGGNALMWAIERHFPLDIIKKILQKDHSLLNTLSWKDKEDEGAEGKRTPLHQAIFSKRKDVIDELLTYDDLNLSLRNQAGQTPLEYARTREISTGDKAVLCEALETAAKKPPKPVTAPQASSIEQPKSVSNPLGKGGDGAAIKDTPLLHSPGKSEATTFASIAGSGKTQSTGGSVPIKSIDQSSSNSGSAQTGDSKTQGTSSLFEAKTALGVAIGLSAIVGIGYALKRIMVSPQEPEDKVRDLEVVYVP